VDTAAADPGPGHRELTATMALAAVVAEATAGPPLHFGREVAGDLVRAFSQTDPQPSQ
jgi:hypothetical protein